MSADNTSQPLREKVQLPPCGFACPRCGFHHLITDEAMKEPIRLLKTAETAPVRCPECGEQHEFRRSDLQVFGW